MSPGLRLRAELVAVLKGRGTCALSEGAQAGTDLYRARDRRHGAGKHAPSFNLPSALHPVCGAVSATFESNQCVIDQQGAHWTHEQIDRSHRILFENCLKTACGE